MTWSKKSLATKTNSINPNVDYNRPSSSNTNKSNKEEYTNIEFNIKKKTSETSLLYVPNKDLIFINHPKYGRVYPVYIGDKEFNKKNSPFKYLPATLLLTGINLLYMLSGFQIFPVTLVYQNFYSKDVVFISSLILNYFLLKKYFKFVGNYDNRVRCLYLLPSGDKVIIENFDGNVHNLEIFDIYEYNMRNKYDDIEKNVMKWNKNSITNDNNFLCSIKWGAANEGYFEGRSIIFDYEIFSQIVARINIDTSIKKFHEQAKLSYYTYDETIKILNKFQNRRRIERIDKKRLSYHYKLLRYKYMTKPKKKEINKEFDFY